MSPPLHAARPGDPIDLGIPSIADARLRGVGGWGHVAEATFLPSNRRVAVRLRDVPTDAARAADQAATLAGLRTALQHPAIAPPIDIGTVGWWTYRVEEWMPGGSIASRISAHGPVDVTTALSTCATLAAGLDAIHACGLLHGWASPYAVRIDGDGAPRWCTLGLAHADLVDTSLDPVPFPIAHAAPEVLSGAPLSVVAEVYTLGTILAVMVRGRAPAEVAKGDTMPVVLQRIVDGYTPDLEGEGVAPAVADLIRRLTALDPRDRPQTAVAAVEAVRDAQAGMGWR